MSHNLLATFVSATLVPFFFRRRDPELHFLQKQKNRNFETTRQREMPHCLVMEDALKPNDFTSLYCLVEAATVCTTAAVKIVYHYSSGKKIMGDLILAGKLSNCWKLEEYHYCNVFDCCSHVISSTFNTPLLLHRLNQGVLRGNVLNSFRKIEFFFLNHYFVMKITGFEITKIGE